MHFGEVRLGSCCWDTGGVQRCGEVAALHKGQSELAAQVDPSPSAMHKLKPEPLRLRRAVGHARGCLFRQPAGAGQLRWRGRLQAKAQSTHVLQGTAAL